MATVTEPVKTLGLERATEAMALAEFIKPLLAGQHRAVQSAVIADLLATWLCGYLGPDRKLVRAAELRGFLRLVRQLLPVTEAELMSKIRPKGSA